MVKRRSSRGQRWLEFGKDPPPAPTPPADYVPLARYLFFLVLGSEVSISKSILRNVFDAIRKKPHMGEEPFRNSLLEQAQGAAAEAGVILQSLQGERRLDVIVLVDLDHLPHSLDALAQLPAAISTVGQGGRLLLQLIIFTTAETPVMPPELTKAVAGYEHCVVTQKTCGVECHAPAHYLHTPFQRVKRELRRLIQEADVRQERR